MPVEAVSKVTVYVYNYANMNTPRNTHALQKQTDLCIVLPGDTGVAYLQHGRPYEESLSALSAGTDSVGHLPPAGLSCYRQSTSAAHPEFSHTAPLSSLATGGRPHPLLNIGARVPCCERIGSSSHPGHGQTRHPNPHAPLCICKNGLFLSVFTSSAAN